MSACIGHQCVNRANYKSFWANQDLNGNIFMNEQKMSTFLNKTRTGKSLNNTRFRVFSITFIFTPIQNEMYTSISSWHVYEKFISNANTKCTAVKNHLYHAKSSTLEENPRSQKWADMCLEGQVSAPVILVMTKAIAQRTLEEKAFASLAEKWAIAEV